MAILGERTIAVNLECARDPVCSWRRTFRLQRLVARAGEFVPIIVNV